MIATLSFTLPEEQEEFENAAHGGRYKSALQEFDNYLRGEIKYTDHPQGEADLLQKIRDNLTQTCPEIWE